MPAVPAACHRINGNRYGNKEQTESRLSSNVQSSEQYLIECMISEKQCCSPKAAAFSRGCTRSILYWPFGRIGTNCEASPRLTNTTAIFLGSSLETSKLDCLAAYPSVLFVRRT